MMSSYKEHLNLKGLDDEDDLSDDEVFTRGGKSIPLEENGVNKPLMAPRVRNKDTLQTKVRKVPSLRVIWAPIFYFCVTLCSVISIIFLIVFLINIFMKSIPHTKNLKDSLSSENIIPCTKIVTKDVWVKTFPMLTTETAIRLNDVNSDGIEDIIIGFGTGADAFYYPRVVCRVYFPKSKDECGGGLLALNGKTGDELWRHYSAHEMFAVNCNIDLNGDGIKDCLCGGRMAGFCAISGKDGTLLWEFDDQNAKIDTSNVYTPQYLMDIDFDGVPDLLVVHGGDPLKEPGSETRLIGRLLIVSGKTGRVLRWMQVPDDRESYYSPQVLTHPDGSKIVLFGTGGETHGGSLWCIKLKHLLNGEVSLAREIYSDKFKGIMTPPVLVDITNDGVLDIVMAMFNSSVIAFDGLNFARLWEYNQPSSESYSTPGVGYFNNDSIPDFIINYQTGPGFPIYYYTQLWLYLVHFTSASGVLFKSSDKPLTASLLRLCDEYRVVTIRPLPGLIKNISMSVLKQSTSSPTTATTILDGRNGKPFLQKPIEMVVGTQTSPLVISVTGKGNDIFLYWISDCHGSENKTKLEFDFIKGTSVHDQSRADFCKLRFKEKLYTRMYALTSHSSIPGTVVYDSDFRKVTEYSNPINYSALGLEFLYRHPGYQQDYELYLDNENPELENRILQQDISDLPNQYDNVQLEKILSGQHRKYPDANEYNVPDYQSDSQVFSPYYMQQNNLGNERFYPLDYRQIPEHFGVIKKTKKFNPWSERYLPFEKFRRDYSLHHKNNNRKKRELKMHTGVIETSKRGGIDMSVLNRKQRHVGPHDGGGIQRVISTGTLAPSLSKDKSGIDLIYATFWFYPSDIQELLPEDKECIASRMNLEKERFEPSSSYYGMDHDAYEEMVTEECLKQSGHLKMHKNRKKGYNPFNRPMGQMTVYRTHLNCLCSDVNKTGQKCAKILPFSEQMWTSYMGINGNCVAKQRHFN